MAGFADIFKCTNFNIFFFVFPSKFPDFLQVNIGAGDVIMLSSNKPLPVMNELIGSISCRQAAVNWLISPWTKWMPFPRQHFQMHFHEWKVLYFDLNFIEVSS